MLTSTLSPQYGRDLLLEDKPLLRSHRIQALMQIEPRPSDGLVDLYKALGGGWSPETFAQTDQSTGVASSN